MTCVGSPDLLAVDSIIAAIGIGPSTQRCEVRSRFRFRESLAPNGLAASHERNVALLLLLRSETHQRRTDPVHVHVLAAARFARLPHLLRKNERGPCIGIAAAPA